MLREPGTADLTADVNYSTLQKAVNTLGRCSDSGREMEGLVVELDNMRVRWGLQGWVAMVPWPRTSFSTRWVLEEEWRYVDLPTFSGHAHNHPGGQVLLQRATSAQAKDLLSGYEMLTHPEKMGTRYKFMALTPSPDHIPTPF